MHLSRSPVCEDEPVGPENRRNIAAIDIGTSSVHLAIARPPIASGPPEILLRQKMPVRLGSGASDMKSLDPEAIDRTVDALGDFRRLADAHDADVYAVATSAVREAEDPSEFLTRARDQAGIDVEVIVGTEEARLIHLGVLGALPISDRRHLVIDIGGGSTELAVGNGIQPEILRSLKLGHVRLTNRFFVDEAPSVASIEACRTFIRSFLARAAVTVKEAEVEVVAGSSGTFETIEGLVTARRRDSRPAPITLDEVRAVVDMIVTERLQSATARIDGVDAHRQDTILAGALLVEALMDTLEFDSFIVSEDALREGLMLDRLNRRQASTDSLRHLSSIRGHSVEAVAERFGENIVHARQSTDISLRIFDATTSLHDYGDHERDVLEAAAMLHNIGRFVGHGAHHRHSYYLIRNSEHLAGFNEHELELMAQVARYHRKSAPKPSHRYYQALDPADQRIVSVLSGMLRIGIALDRTYRNVAGDIHVAVDRAGESIGITVIGDDLELELFAANERKGLLEASLGVEVVIDGTPETCEVPQPAV